MVTDDYLLSQMYFLDADDGSDDEETLDDQNDENNMPPEKRLEFLFTYLSDFYNSSR